jgi:diguanylate cyclase (GGDEF)-like protein/PAS domain S-box-containing protein
MHRFLRPLDDLSDLGTLGLEILAGFPGVAVHVVDADLRYVFASGAALADRGWDPRSFPGRRVDDVLPSETARQVMPHWRAALNGESSAFEYEGEDATHWYRIEMQPLTDRAGGVIGAIAISRDITDRKVIEESLRRSRNENRRLRGGLETDAAGEALAAVQSDVERDRVERELRVERERFERAFEDAPIGMALVSPEGRFMKVNRSLCEITGYDRDALLALSFQDITHPDDLDADLRHLQDVISGEIRSYQMEKRYITRDANVVWVNLSVSLVRDDLGAPVHFISQIEDISERKRTEERLHHLADHDGLTGLFNRRRFEQELSQQHARCQRYGETAALLLLDIDRFKLVNDTRGHRVGDKVLQHLAGLLSRRLRRSDIVARLGGDEFAIILPRIQPPQARSVAQQLVEVVRSSPPTAGGREVPLTASVGATMLDEDTPDVESVLVAADEALYSAKAAGRDRSVASFG